MKFKVTKTSDYKLEREEEITSLESLLKFVERENTNIIIQAPWSNKDPRWELEIYDDYRE